MVKNKKQRNRRAQKARDRQQSLATLQQKAAREGIIGGSSKSASFGYFFNLKTALILDNNLERNINNFAKNLKNLNAGFTQEGDHRVQYLSVSLQKAIGYLSIGNEKFNPDLVKGCFNEINKKFNQIEKLILRGDSVFSQKSLAQTINLFSSLARPLPKKLKEKYLSDFDENIPFRLITAARDATIQYVSQGMRIIRLSL